MQANNKQVILQVLTLLLFCFHFDILNGMYGVK